MPKYIAFLSLSLFPFSSGTFPPVQNLECGGSATVGPDTGSVVFLSHQGQDGNSTKYEGNSNCTFQLEVLCPASIRETR